MGVYGKVIQVLGGDIHFCLYITVAWMCFNYIYLLHSYYSNYI